MSVTGSSNYNYIQMEERPRRLYCLTCGKGALIPLPANTFVTNHMKDHKMEAEDVDEEFIVVDRGDDLSIRLDDQIDVLMDNKNLVWGGVKIARG